MEGDAESTTIDELIGVGHWDTPLGRAYAKLGTSPTLEGAVARWFLTVWVTFGESSANLASLFPRNELLYLARGPRRFRQAVVVLCKLSTAVRVGKVEQFAEYCFASDLADDLNQRRIQQLAHAIRSISYESNAEWRSEPARIEDTWPTRD